MKISFEKVIASMPLKLAVNEAPKIKSAQFGRISDSSLKQFSYSVSSAAKARFALSSKNKSSKLPFLFLPETLETRAFYKKVDEFKSYAKKLNPAQKIIKDEYSNIDLLGKLYTADEVIHSDKGYTDAICDCICVLLNNKNDAYLLHLSPGKHKKSSQIMHMQEKIGSFIDNLTKNNENCSAFLFGGRKNKSEQLHSDILSVLSKKGIKSDEILYDVNDGAHSIYFDVKKGIVLDSYIPFDIEDLKVDFEKVNIFK